MGEQRAQRSAASENTRNSTKFQQIIKDLHQFNNISAANILLIVILWWPGGIIWIGMPGARLTTNVCQRLISDSFDPNIGQKRQNTHFWHGCHTSTTFYLSSRIIWCHLRYTLAVCVRCTLLCVAANVKLMAIFLNSFFACVFLGCSTVSPLFLRLNMLLHLKIEVY